MSTTLPLAKLRRTTARGVIALGWAVTLMVLALVWVGPDELRKDWSAVVNPAQPYHAPPLAPPKWVPFSSRLLDVGQDRKGWSVMRMLLAWRQAGLTVEEARALSISVHEFALPTVMGRASESLEAAHQARLKAVEQVVAITRPDAWQALGRITPDTPLGLPDDIASVVSNPDGQELLAWVALFGEIDLMSSRSTGLEDPQDLSWEEAKDSLAQATHDVGLKHVRVPLALWGCAPCLSDMALGLRQANADLSAIAGWSGPVLGLDGRVGLTLGVLESAHADGHERSGESLEVRSDWQDLAHEWFHALDLVVGRQTQPFPRPEPLSAYPPGSWRWVASSSAARHWWRAQNRLFAAGAPWIERRRVFGEQTLDPNYWTAPAELLAFGFEHHVRTSTKSTWLLEPPHDGLSYDPAFVLAPLDVEQAKMAPLWEPMLRESGRSLGLLDQ